MDKQSIKCIIDELVIEYANEQVEELSGKNLIDEYDEELDDWYVFRNEKGSERARSYGWTLYKYLGANSKYGVPVGYGQDEIMTIYDLSKCLMKNGYVSYK